MKKPKSCGNWEWIICGTVTYIGQREGYTSGGEVETTAHLSTTIHGFLHKIITKAYLTST